MGQTVVLVTHDLRSAYRGNRVLYFRDGGIVGECRIDEENEKSENLENPKNSEKTRQAMLKAFLEEMEW